MDKGNSIPIKNGLFEGIIEYFNNYDCDIMQYSKKELIGKTPSLLKIGFHDDEFYKDMGIKF